MPISPKSAKAIADTVEKATKKAVKKASEALGEHEGKYLNITQSDRMRVGGKDLGGPGFPTLSLERPEYEGAVWGVGNPSVASTIIGANKRYPEGQAIWTTMIGSPEQHRSNQHVFDELHKQFKKSAKAGNLDPVLHDAINQRLRMAIDADGLPMFPEDIDILSKDFKKFADRFDKRAVAADVMAGVGIGGKKGQIFDYNKVMGDLTDPMVKDVPSGSLGYRLFTLSGEKSERPDLHSAFPHILHGEDLGVSYTPAPREIIMQKWIDDFVQRTGRKPGFLDWTRGYAPSTQITEEMLTNLQREGFAKGGKVDLEAEFRKADMIAPQHFDEGGKAKKKKSKGYGERIDGTEKERGFLGEIRMPDGRDVMTEVSVGMPNTDELFRPSIIRGMHPADLNYLRETGLVPEDLYQASLLHAQKRIKEGKSPFWNAKEDAEPQHFGLGGLAKGAKKIADTAKKVTAKDNLSKYMQGSKAVDEAGNPKVYYHGTTAKDDFSEFSPASFFTDSPKEASAYTMYKDLERKEKALKKYSLSNDVSNAGSYVPYTGTLSDIADPQVGALYATDNGAYRYLGDGRWEGMSKLDVDYNKYDPKTDSMMLKKVKKGQAVDTVREHKQWAHNTFTEGEGGRVYPVYLDIKNPVELSALEANVLGKRLGADDKLVQEFIDKYAKQGYDAIVTKSDEAAYFPEVRESLGGIPTQYIPFRPEQIKSAVGNVGTYDPNAKDILKANGGEVQSYGVGGLAKGAKKIKEVTKKVLESKGKYGAERVEKAADLVPNLEKQFTEKALYDAFVGDNAKGLMVMNPKSFESYSKPLWDEYVEPEYIRELAQIARQKGFEDVPFLMLGRKELKYIPKDLQELYIAGHEGRHRNRALSKLGDESTLIQLLPKGSLREDLPRLSQEEYIDALKKELGLNPLVRPEQDTEEIRRLIRLPEIFAKGGEVKGYKEGGDLEEEFRKADMIDMSGFRQDPLEKATRRADNRPKKRNVMSDLNQPIKPFFDPTGKLRMYSDVIKDVGADLAGQLGEQIKKDYGSLNPRAISDVALNVGADWLGSAADLVSMLPEKFKSTPVGLDEYLMSKLSKKSGKKSSNNLDEMFTSENLRKKLKETGLVERDRPTVELPLAFATPFAAKSIAKGAKAIAPEMARAIEKATVDPYKFNIVKPEGGQFIDSTLKENLKQLKQGDEDNQINKALDSWVDSTLRKYVVNRMGTESDEVRKLFDKGITHVPPEQLKGAPSVATLEQHRARLPGSGKRAETEVGQAWEDASDYSLYGRRRSSYDDRDVEKYPWLSKMAPDDMVYGASVDSSALKDRLGFGHVIDVIRGDLRSGKLRPEQLNKVSVEDAIKRTHAFNQEMAKKAEETAITVQSGMPVHREYPEGYKWVELKHPDAKKTEEMLTYEGDTMGHCVGSYCEDVMGGQTRIFSLRDAKGQPHVTIEVQPEKGVVYSQMADLLGEKEVDRLLESGMSPRQIVEAYPELEELRTYKINQIKGKGNEKPSAKYIPFVQDFVRNPVAGKEWADVGDFRNTDFINANLLRKEGVMPDADTETMNTVLQELDRIYPMNKLPGGQREFVGEYGELLPTSDMLKAQIQDLASPYLTKEDIINHLRSKEALPVEQSYSKYYENLPKDEGMAHGGDVHMAKGGWMGAVEAASKLGQESMRRFAGKLNKLSRNVAYNTYEQVPYVGAKHLEGMTERPFGEKLFFTEEAPWGSPEKDADLLAKYLGLESGPSQKGVGLYQPPIEGAPLEFNPQISSRTLVKSDKGRRKENLIAEPDKASMTALGATRGYLDVQGASPWVRPSQGSGRLYSGFHISLDGKPTEEEMRKIGEIQARYGFWGAGDLGKSGVYVGFNPEMTRDDLNKMQRAFRKDIKEALGDRVVGVKMMKSEGDYPAFEEAWKAPQGTGTVTRQLMEYLDTAKEKNPLLAEYYAQKPSTELQKLMQEMNIRDIKAPEKYGVGAPREDVMKARDIFSEYGIEGLRDALNRGEYLPAAVAIPSGIELFRDDN